MNQEQSHLAQKENTIINSALFAMSSLQTSYKGLPETNKAQVKTFNQIDQGKEKLALKVHNPSIVISSFSCLCPACATCGAE